MRVVGGSSELDIGGGRQSDLPVPVWVSILSRHVLSNQGVRFGPDSGQQLEAVLHALPSTVTPAFSLRSVSL